MQPADVVVVMRKFLYLYPAKNDYNRASGLLQWLLLLLLLLLLLRIIVVLPRRVPKKPNHLRVE
jgi:hypothetical protein